MTPETTLGSQAEEIVVPSTTDGLTVKVVKGSLWTLLGQVAPAAAGFFCTPFVIRLLGAEQYGIYVLVLLLPAYLMFADFGMGMASTKFAAEAYADGDHEREGRLVRTSVLIALFTSLPVAAGLALFAEPVARLANIPPDLVGTAAIALRIGAAMLVVNFLNSILNTPQLTRLRMDLNTIVNAVPKMLAAIAVPVLIYFGFGIVGAVMALFVSTVVTLGGHLIVSGKLLPQLSGSSLERPSIRPLLKFGTSLVLAFIAGVVLGSLEKLVLVRVTDVTTLAHYSVAFTLSNMVTMFSVAMVQSLIPAFSQLTRDDRRAQLETLYARGIRISVFCVLPMLVMLAVIAKPFFTIWAGEDFGRESTVPFYILLVGLFFNLNAYIPWSAILAFGRTDILAKNYWLQILPYIALVLVLTTRFGATGAAAAWTIRVIVDAGIFLFLVRRSFGLGTGIWRFVGSLAVGTGLLLPCLIAVALLAGSLWLIPITLVCVSAYGAFVWKKVATDDEKEWLLGRLGSMLRTSPRPV